MLLEKCAGEPRDFGDQPADRTGGSRRQLCVLKTLLLTRLPASCGWVPLGLMSVAAPWIAAHIHSELVFQRGIRLYNAEIGGIYFQKGWPQPPQPNLATALLCASGFGVPAIMTFVALLPFRKRAGVRWLFWFCAIAIWVWVDFRLEFAIH